jgi:MOSC domain-containing protein YiiM
MLAEFVSQLQAEGFRAAPGELGEQIVLAGLDPGSLAEGVRLRLGKSAVIEFINLRTGCSRFEHIQGRPKTSVAGRLGFMARVIQGGEIALGDEVCIEPQTN